jgi:hypothetical protein
MMSLPRRCRRAQGARPDLRFRASPTSRHRPRGLFVAIRGEHHDERVLGMAQERGQPGSSIALARRCR